MSTHYYSFMESMDPENILKVFENIPLFVLEYFMQRDISGYVDEMPGKSCIFHHTNDDGISLISALIVMTKFRRELEFLHEERAFDIMHRFEKKVLIFLKVRRFACI